MHSLTPQSAACASSALIEAMLPAHLSMMAADPSLRRVPNNYSNNGRRLRTGQSVVDRPYQLGDFFLGKAAGSWTTGDARQMALSYPDSLAARYYSVASGPCDIGLLASLVSEQLQAEEQTALSTWCSACAQGSQSANTWAAPPSQCAFPLDALAHAHIRRRPLCWAHPMPKRIHPHGGRLLRFI